MRALFTIAIFKIKADIRMNKTTLNSQKEKHSMLFLRRATSCHLILWRWQFYFYPRSPCGERRARWVYRSRVRLFLSTLSLRRATLLIVAIRGIVLNFYPRSPCGERRSAQFLGAESGYFYPRSPCGERQQLCPLLAIRTNFYPRSPCGERRSDGFHRGAKVAISIHALLAESDYIAAAAAGSCPAFLSTLSLRRATR